MEGWSHSGALLHCLGWVGGKSGSHHQCMHCLGGVGGGGVERVAVTIGVSALLGVGVGGGAVTVSVSALLGGVRVEGWVGWLSLSVYLHCWRRGKSCSHHQCICIAGGGRWVGGGGGSRHQCISVTKGGGRVAVTISVWTRR